MRLSLILCSLFLSLSCTNQSKTNFDFLAGTWKIKDKGQYDVWVKTSKREFNGYSYKIVENQKSILESIVIKLKGKQVVYEATVPDQNEGETVRFTLNHGDKSCFSFENAMHDFPKKIQYHQISNNELMIRVLGDEGKGFSYTLIRQDIE